MKKQENTIQLILSLEILDKEKVFMNHSKGGVTFSGGEPMLQAEFLA